MTPMTIHPIQPNPLEPGRPVPRADGPELEAAFTTLEQKVADV